MLSNLDVENEELRRQDLKYSVKVFVRSLESEILRHTINQGLSIISFHN